MGAPTSVYCWNRWSFYSLGPGRSLETHPSQKMGAAWGKWGGKMGTA
jgi:hypothetical protein